VTLQLKKKKEKKGGGGGERVLIQMDESTTGEGLLTRGARKGCLSRGRWQKYWKLAGRIERGRGDTAGRGSMD